MNVGSHLVIAVTESLMLESKRPGLSTDLEDCWRMTSRIPAPISISIKGRTSTMRGPGIPQGRFENLSISSRISLLALPLSGEILPHEDFKKMEI